MTSIKRRIRARRNEHAFDHALRTATPNMRHELIAMATRQNGNH